ncbi:MAG: hypothetical protein ACOZAO_03785 [Patescibacteria group bacterium]
MDAAVLEMERINQNEDAPITEIGDREARFEINKVGNLCASDNPELELRDAITPLRHAYVDLFKSNMAFEKLYDKDDTLARSTDGINLLINEMPPGMEQEEIMLTEARTLVQSVLDARDNFKENRFNWQNSITPTMRLTTDAEEHVAIAYRGMFPSGEFVEKSDLATQIDELDIYTNGVAHEFESSYYSVRQQTVRGSQSISYLESMRATGENSKNKLDLALEQLEIVEHTYRNRAYEEEELSVRRLRLDLEELRLEMSRGLLDIEDKEVNFVAKGSQATDRLIDASSKYEALNSNVAKV